MDDIETEYWKNFYTTYNEMSPSNFSFFVLDFLKQTCNNNIKILELGCGNGKDTYNLSRHYTTTGVDVSCKPHDKENSNFILGDMISIDKAQYNVIYSRFTFHSINDALQDQLIKSIDKPNTLLRIETRSVKGQNTERFHGDNHYRNLTNIDTLKTMIAKYNFEILYCKESDGCAVYKTEDPICIRLICKKL